MGVRPGEGRDRRGAPGLIGRNAAGAALASGARSALNCAAASAAAAPCLRRSRQRSTVPGR